MSQDEPGLADAARKQWGALRGLLKHRAKTASPEKTLEEIAEVERHMKSAADTIPPHLEGRLSALMRQMRATTTLYDEDDEPTLIPIEDHELESA